MSNSVFCLPPPFAMTGIGERTIQNGPRRAVAEQLFAARFRQRKKGKRNAGKRGPYHPHAYGARVAPRKERLTPPFPLSGALACRRSTSALAKGTYVTPGATQAMLPGTRSERVLPAFACPSPVSTSRADRSIGRHDARAGRGTGRILLPAATAPAPHPEYLRERRP